MGLTSGIESLRRRLVVCVTLLVGIAVAGLLMAPPDDGRGAASTAAAPLASTEGPTTTASTSATVAPSGAPAAPALPGPAPFTPPSTGTPVPTGGGPTTTTPRAAVAPISLPPPATCGSTIRKAGGGTWHCTFDDEFNGTSVDLTKWRVQETAWNGFHSGPECFEDRPANVAVAGGVLRLTARRETAGFTCQAPGHPFGTEYTSGMLTSFGKFTQAYGRWEIRAKLPTTAIKGLQTSFWLWPQDVYRYGEAYPASGEIDIAESYTQYPDRVIPYIHYIGSGGNVTNNYCLISNLGDFHTYTLEWTIDALTILYDGKVCLQNHWSPLFPMQHPAPFDQPFMVSLTQALGVTTNAFDPATTPLPATTTVDYVRIWK